MKVIFNLLKGLPNTRDRRDDDFGDRLNYRYSVSLFAVFAVIVTSKQYVGSHIRCWVPAHFSDSWKSYTNDYCWVKDTYYLNFDEYIPKEHEHEKRIRLSYYQWVPIILLVQAFMYYAPNLVWKNFNNR